MSKFSRVLFLTEQCNLNCRYCEHKDKNINMGLYNYPILMTSDLTIFDCEKVFIGSDQLQHIEMANDITQRFNSITRSQVLKIPEPVQQGHNILGFDGNKMSKSYNNSIPIMCSSKKLKKHIFSIKTNSKNLGESKYWDESPITSIFEAFATKREIENLKEEMLYGKGWGEVKTEVFQKVNDKLQIPRQKYHEFENDEVFEIINETYLDLKPQINIKMDEIKEKLFATN